MISQNMKCLLCLVFLVLSGVAYALTGTGPPVDVPVTITGSGGIACAFGPNVSSIPAPAAAAGFNTCAANYDFTNTNNFTSNGHTYNFSDMTTWLDCKGAAFPLWWNHTFSGGTTTPCNDFSMVNDGGVQAVQLIYTQSDYSAQNNSGGADNTNMESYKEGAPLNTLPEGFVFPFEFYAEFMVRDVSSDSILANGGNISDWWAISATGDAGTQYRELDFQETFPGGSDGTGTNENLTVTLETHAISSANVPGYDHNNYFVVGERVTMDSSAHTAICVYVNGVQIKCTTFTWPTTTDFGGLALRMNTAAITPPATLSGTVMANTKYFRVFTCAAGVPLPNALGGFACAGPPITSNP